MPAQYQELTTALIVLGGALVGLALLRLAVVPLTAQGLLRRGAIGAERLLYAVVAPAMALGLLLGLRMALLQFSSLENYVPGILHWSRVLSTLITVWALLRLSNALARQRISHLTNTGARDRVQYVNALRKVSGIVIVVIGGLMLVGQMGYKITPLLTGLGIGGLAVALALQDTLANVFAGFYMMFDQPVHVGDYIQLKTGEEGFVEEIGWRNTRLRPWTNSEILVPNAVLAKTIFINHYLPVQELSVIVNCGVSYYSDLAHVERVTKEVAREVMGRVKGSAPNWDPLVYFESFDDSNISFRTVLRACEFATQYELRSEFIKALHQRFGAEGIEISFPMRKVEVSQVPPGLTGAPRTEAMPGRPPGNPEEG